MKPLTLVALCLFTFSISHAQDNFSVPELTQDQAQEVLYAHVFSYAVSGISYAKSMGSTPEAYGNYVGKLFTPWWDPSAGLPGFANQMMFILAGIHPDNEMEIMAQDENSIRFRMKNVDLSFKQGPMFGVSYDDFLEFSSELLVVLADFLSLDFKDSFVDGWYEVSLKAR